MDSLDHMKQSSGLFLFVLTRVWFQSERIQVLYWHSIIKDHQKYYDGWIVQREIFGISHSSNPTMKEEHYTE